MILGSTTMTKKKIAMRKSSTIFSLFLTALVSKGSHAFQHSPQSGAFVKRSAASLGSSAQSSVSAPSVVLQRVFAQDSRPVILFDGVCNLCNSAVNLALDWDPSGKLRFAALQSKVGQNLLQAHGRDANDISSIVFVTPKGAYTKSDAILGITKELNPLPFVPLKPLALAGQYLVPQILRDAVYDGVANNRYSIMGKRDQCRFDADGEFDDRFVDDNLAED